MIRRVLKEKRVATKPPSSVPDTDTISTASTAVARSTSGPPPYDSEAAARDKQVRGVSRMDSSLKFVATKYFLPIFRYCISHSLSRIPCLIMQAAKVWIAKWKEVQKV